MAPERRGGASTLTAIADAKVGRCEIGQDKSEPTTSSRTIGTTRHEAHKPNSRFIYARIRDSIELMDFVRPVEAVIPGAQGRILAVLADTSAELNLRTLARLADVSLAQASRVMPDLVDLGVVERREVPPSSQFRLARSNVAARAVLDLARARDTVLHDIGATAAQLIPAAVSVIVFGSFSRGEADHDSDLDVVIVRPDDFGDKDSWASSVEAWREATRAVSGNRVEVLEVGADQARTRLAGRQSLWRDVKRDGIVVYGLSLAVLAEVINA